MKMLKTTTVLAVASALLLATSAQAGNKGSRGAGFGSAPVYKEVVHSTNGNVVTSTNGNCVITKWDAQGKTACVNLDIDLRTVYFNFNSSSLTPAAKAKLNTLAASLKTNKVKSVKIVGFADEIGSTGYNQSLSVRRANTVASYLKAKGISVKGKSEVRGLGETASVSQCEGITGKELRACLWRDRRVEVEVIN